MASQTRTYARKKLLGQVYTPFHIVDKILRHCGFYEADLTEKRILDPACGDGRFLVPMAEFIIRNTPTDKVADKLQRLHGWDIDQKALQQCRENLDSLIAPLGIEVTWNLRKCDALKQWRSRDKFDLIVGNPPYIRIQHLPDIQRKYIQKHYSFCSTGSTDAFIAFFQLATKLLARDGICGLITPNSYLVSESGGPLRKYFYKNQNLKLITNYRDVPVFGAASTYPAITIFGGQHADVFRFEQCINNRFEYEGRDIPHSELKVDIPWQLSLVAQATQEGLRLGDICKISVGLTTLADGCYLFNIISEKNGLVYAKNKNGFFTHLEMDLLKPIIKGSKLKAADDAVIEYILFPYQKDDSDKQRIIPEETLKTEFPQTYSYLLKVKSELDRRDNGKPNAVAWYAFGRAQGLDNAFGKKIIFSPINREPNFILYENPDVTVYSGYFIKYDGDYQTLLEQLNSQRMADFVAIAGRDFQGGYKGYNKKVIENFIITNHSRTMDITTAIDRLTWLCQHIPALIEAIPVTALESKPAPEKWSKKEILGHLIDSAANNHQRFIRIQAEHAPVIFYNQNDWVGLSRYNDIATEQLVATWKHYNLHLAAIAKAIAPENLARNGVGRDGQPHTLKWYFDDYVDHMEHHLRQIVAY